MTPPPVGSDDHQVTPKITHIKATYYHYPQPKKPPMARRMTLVERIKTHLSKEKKSGTP
jgi:hypothetical protein